MNTIMLLVGLTVAALFFYTWWRLWRTCGILTFVYVALIGALLHAIMPGWAGPPTMALAWLLIVLDAKAKAERYTVRTEGTFKP